MQHIPLEDIQTAQQLGIAMAISENLMEEESALGQMQAHIDDNLRRLRCAEAGWKPDEAERGQHTIAIMAHHHRLITLELKGRQQQRTRRRKESA
jgi:hypothetical protein